MKIHIISTLVLVIAPLTYHMQPAHSRTGPGNYGGVSKAFICTQDGDRANLRGGPGRKYRVVTKVPPGRQVTLFNGSQIADGYTWRKINFLGATGWIRGDYLCS